MRMKHVTGPKLVGGLRTIATEKMTIDMFPSWIFGYLEASEMFESIILAGIDV